MTGPELTRARPDDLPAVRRLLEEAALPLEGVVEHFEDFLVARADGALVGCVGLECYGESVLLRSLAVAPSYRKRGLGRALTRKLLDDARQRGVKRVFLLTETAADFFAVAGFQRLARDDADAAVRESVEFRTACPQSAVCMRLELSPVR